MSLGSLLDEAIRAYLLEDPSRMSSGFHKIDFGPLVETLRSRYAEVRRRRVPWVVETLRKNAKRIVMDDAQLSSFYRELSRSKTVNGEKRSRPSDENDDFIAPNGENLDDFLGSEEFLKNVREVGRFLLDRNDDNRFLRKIRSLLISGTFRSEPRALAHAICGEFGAVFLAEIDCECSMKAKDFDEIVAKVRKTENAEDSEAMKVVLLNDVHTAFSTKSDGLSRRLLSQLLDITHGFEFKRCVVIGTTNDIDSVHDSYRRWTRFDREIVIDLPTQTLRRSYIQKMIAEISLDLTNDQISVLATDAAYQTPGFASLELEDLMVRTVSKLKDRSSINEIRDCLTRSIPEIDVLSKRCSQYVITNPQDVSWDDIGGAIQSDVRQNVNAYLSCITRPELCENLGLSSKAGLLFHGPPGCGKTLLARVLAKELNVNFMAVSGPELLNMYLGESERAVRRVFAEARLHQPCIVFFDEIDALCRRRSGIDGDSGGTWDNVVNQFLTEMDGMRIRQSVYVMGATNRIDSIDPAMLRPGRFDRIIYVGLPNHAERIDILTRMTRTGRPPLDSDVDFQEISDLTAGFSGADLRALLTEAAMFVLKEQQTGGDEGSARVCRRHFLAALEIVRPTTKDSDFLKN